MNIVTTHSYGHRLRTDGLVESAPFSQETVTYGTWDIKAPEDMDLSGGDWQLIIDTLKRFRQVFQFTGRRTPAPAKPTVETKPEASQVA